MVLSLTAFTMVTIVEVLIDVHLSVYYQAIRSAILLLALFCGLRAMPVRSQRWRGVVGTLIAMAALILSPLLR
jgi:hypothetical protein